MGKLYIAQDGPDFYAYDEQGKFVEAMSAPMVVHDFDLKAAKKARQWFVDVMKAAGQDFTWKKVF
jgi:hypothetical protein